MWWVWLCGAAGAALLAGAARLAGWGRTESLRGRHVLVTGGSSGIGLACALEAARRGAHVTLAARGEMRLADAVRAVRACAGPGQAVRGLALDVRAGWVRVAAELAALEASAGPVYLLVNCAGACVCGRFEDVSDEDARAMMDLNYRGSADTTRYVLPGMKARGEGRIVLVASEAALIGIYGYSAYSASKWAIRGLAESLMMELIGTGVHLTLAFPPDTDTPGFAAENETKPKETKLISGSGGLVSPDVVGQQIVKDAMAGKAYSVVGFSGHLMSLLYCGSIDSVWQVLIQVCTMGFLRAIMVGFILSFQQIVRRELKNRKKAEEAKTE